MPDLDPEFREIVDNNFWDMMEAPMNVLERKRVKCSAFKSEVNTHRNAAPINAETVKALMDERDRLRAELEAARAENERLTRFNKLWKESAKANRYFNRSFGELYGQAELDIENLTKELSAAQEIVRDVTETRLSVEEENKRLIKELAAEKERREKAEAKLYTANKIIRDSQPYIMIYLRDHEPKRYTELKKVFEIEEKIQ